ncbi:large ribosomal subunit protein mL46 [Chanos chanos]|uniref:Large ribosomal subunit protein mL46 n=1 Tax=Chanos chanos TaxID=29144 RepID=A0A6J2ULN0_CHACN|nr:39S ribosomal protein L46, mitochondrial [Chanos chanos]
MAAPYLRCVNGPLWKFFRSGVIFTPIRNISLNQFCRSAHKLKNETVSSPWRLYAAVCLQRLPIVSQERSPIEEQFLDLMHQMELERSLLADHELRLLEDAERMSRKQEEDYDSDEEEDYAGQDIVTAQDLEDTWEQKLKQFQPASREKSADKTELSSSNRCLGDNLVLLVKQSVGGEKIWLLPQLQWETGETLKQTAERALARLPGADLKATFLGNAPCGFYKYKFPKDIQTESCVGAKVFFFKALLSVSSHSPLEKDSFIWVKKSELPEYLKPEYLKQVNRFIISL